MQWISLCVLLLAISEPLLSHAKKLVVVMPRQIKRSPAISWRPGPMHYRKSAHGDDYHHHGYHSRPAPYYSKRPYHRPPPYTHGGDDYETYETMNHVHIPYGKDIGHGMPYGKGYGIPYESLKGAYSYARESRYPRYKAPKYMEPDYPPTSYSTGPDYPTGHAYEGAQMDALFSDLESALDYRERRNDRKKYYNSRSVDKELGFKAQIDLNSLLQREREKDQHQQLEQQQYQQLQQEHEQQQLQQQQLQQQQLQQQQLQQQQLQQQQLQQQQLQQQQQQLQQQQLQQQQQQQSTNIADMYKQALPQGHDIQGSVMVPAGIPSGTIGGNKDGVVLRDTVALDDYHRKLQEITKSWPSFLNAGMPDGMNDGGALEQQVQSYPSDGLQGSGFTGSQGWYPDYAQAKQGYAVKEELAEPGHDFRNMPVQNTAYQGIPMSVNVAVPGLTQTVHG